VNYQVSVSGSPGTVVGKTRVKGDRSELVAQFWIAGSTIMVPYETSKRAVQKIGFWRYRAGGTPLMSIDAPPGVAELFGSTVSAAQK
jgi:hypothetical protein